MGVDHNAMLAYGFEVTEKFWLTLLSDYNEEGTELPVGLCTERVGCAYSGEWDHLVIIHGTHQKSVSSRRGVGTKVISEAARLKPDEIHLSALRQYHEQLEKQDHVVGPMGWRLGLEVW